MDSQWGSTDLPRYWITLSKDVIWDYPKDFSKQAYPYETNISAISDLLREYIDTPRDQFFAKCFTSDCWGLTDILKAADRRIGKEQLNALLSRTENDAAIRVVQTRLILRIIKKNKDVPANLAER
jgi:hypothetical protein